MQIFLVGCKDGDSSPAQPGCERELLQLIGWWENHSDCQCILSVSKGAARKKGTDCSAGCDRTRANGFKFL